MEHEIPAWVTRGSLVDMLPDELPQVETPDGKPYTRSGMPVVVGLHEHRCAICKRAFEATAAHAYKLKTRDGRKTKMYCSYTCFRVDERPLLERKKQAALHRWTPEGRATKTPRERAEAELRKCRERLAHWKAYKEDAAYWESLAPSVQRKVEDSIARWLAREIVAEEEINILQDR